MKAKIFRNRKQSQTIDLVNSNETGSAILIPENLMHVYKDLCKNRTRSEVLGYLLSRYKNFLLFAQIDISNRVKTKYQSKGQNLNRISFKPKNKDWIELGIISSALGCSRTLIVSYFLELELLQIANFFEIPSVKKEVSYLVKHRANSVWRLLPGKGGFQRILWYLRP